MEGNKLWRSERKRGLISRGNRSGEDKCMGETNGRFRLFPKVCDTDSSQCVSPVVRAISGD